MNAILSYSDLTDATPDRGSILRAPQPHWWVRFPFLTSHPALMTRNPRALRCGQAKLLLAVLGERVGEAESRCSLHRTSLALRSLLAHRSLLALRTFFVLCVVVWPDPRNTSARLRRTATSLWALPFRDVPAADATHASSAGSDSPAAARSGSAARNVVRPRG